jgi:hypothetical protein
MGRWQGVNIGRHAFSGRFCIKFILFVDNTKFQWYIFIINPALFSKEAIKLKN